jgi:hypothetical protein
MENQMENFHHEPKATDGFSTTEKVKAVIPGTAEHRAKEAAQDRLDTKQDNQMDFEKDNFHHEPEATDGFSTKEKIKAVIPGTAEYRAKEAAQDRLDAKQDNQMDSEKDKATDGLSTTEKIKSMIPEKIMSVMPTTEQIKSYIPTTEQIKSVIPTTEQIKSVIPTTEKIKSVIPGMASQDKQMDLEKEDFHHEPKATDGFTTGEKIKSVIPGTAEYRAKNAAQERLDGQLPHSTIQQVENPDQPMVVEKKKDWPQDLPAKEPTPTDGWTRSQKLKAMIPGTVENRAKELNKQTLPNFHHEPQPTDGFSMTETVKAVIPGTPEYRAKQAAQDRINGQLPHSIIGEVGQPSIAKVE